MLCSSYGVNCYRVQITRRLLRRLKALPDAVWIPLGPTATAGVEWVIQQGALRRDNVLIGLPHPSPASMERIKYFLGQKHKSDLSIKTEPIRLDAARERLTAQIISLGAADAVRA